VKFTRVNGRTALKKGRGSGKEFLVILTSVNGLRAKQMVLVCTSGKTGTDTKESGNSVLNMDKGLICLQTVILILDNTLTESRVAQASISGRILLFMLVSLEKE